MTHDNPYYYTVPADGANFVGRQSIVDEIVADLTRPRCDSWAIIGGRRFGKSSLLKATETQLLAYLSTRQRGDRHIVPIVVDLKRCGIQSEEHIYACILRELNRALRRKRLPTIDLSHLLLEQNPAKAVTFADFEDTFEDLASFVEEHLGPLRVVLLLDEVEAMVHYSWSDTLFNQLRALIYDGFLANTVKLILTGSAGFIKTQEGSPLWNAIKICYLQTLSPHSLTELFALGGKIPGDSAAIIQEQSGGHPFVAQYLLHHLWHQENALTQVTTAQVVQFALQMYQDRLDDFHGWWEAIGEEGQRIYALLADAPGEIEESILVAQLSHKTMALDRSLRSLRYHGLVARSDDLQRYQLAGTLFRDWYLRNAAGQSPLQVGTIHTAMIPLRELLCILYDSSENARRIARECGLDLTEIVDSGSVVNYWSNVLVEAQKRELIKIVVDRAMAEYPNKANQLKQAYEVHADGIRQR